MRCGGGAEHAAVLSVQLQAAKKYTDISTAGERSIRIQNVSTVGAVCLEVGAAGEIFTSLGQYRRIGVLGVGVGGGVWALRVLDECSSRMFSRVVEKKIKKS